MKHVMLIYCLLNFIAAKRTTLRISFEKAIKTLTLLDYKTRDCWAKVHQYKYSHNIQSEIYPVSPKSEYMKKKLALEMILERKTIYWYHERKDKKHPLHNDPFCRTILNNAGTYSNSGYIIVVVTFNILA